MSAPFRDSLRGKASSVDNATAEGVRSAITSARDYFLKTQHPDGHWSGELEGDTILESEYVLTMHFIGLGHLDKVRKASNYVRSKQLPEGGWSIYKGGPAEVSASAKAYFVLKLLGDKPDAPHMIKAREVIRSLGGLDATNSFTRIYLAIFGLAQLWPPAYVALPLLGAFLYFLYFGSDSKKRWRH